MKKLKKVKKSKLDITLTWLFSFIIFLSFIFVLSAVWAFSSFNNIKMDEIVYHLSTSIVGTDSSKISSYIFSVLPTSIILSIITNMILFYDFKKELHIEITIRKKVFAFKILPLKKITKYIAASILSIIMISICLYKLEFFDYIRNQRIKSLFIEDNYINPDKVDIKAPDKKKNLIYIFLESMEDTYKSKSDGGAFNTNIIPELTNLQKENTSFKNGAYTLSGTTYTMGAMVGHTAGIPVKIGIQPDELDGVSTLLPGASNIGSILNKYNYNQMIMFGSDSTFASRNIYFEENNYKVWDVSSAINEGKMTDKDKVWWGFDDSDLFKYSKEKILELSKKDKPFNFTLLTANTHFEDGYLEEICENKYDNKYANTIACSSKQVYEFVEWIKKQSFYHDTVIVIAGDHLTMDKDFLNDIDKSYERTIYNVIINSSLDLKNNDRIYSTIDLFPTTLASMGFEIKGDRLGLGTNLYSSKLTIIEEYGIEKVNNEFEKNSTYYTNKFILNKSDKESRTKNK